MWQCHNQLTAFFVHISRHYCFQLIAVLFSFVSDTAGEHWRRNWLNVEKLPIADAEETEGMRKICVSRCLVLSSCLLQQLWLMKARKGQKHLWPTYLPDPPQTTWWNYSTHLFIAKNRQEHSSCCACSLWNLLVKWWSTWFTSWESKWMVAHCSAMSLSALWVVRWIIPDDQGHE